uniref:Uncharacterized protein n=1 Tax=uncultured bacterium contig00154 TaxID=1181592 RepID=A0A806K1R8_9BACT|nr:hypothetical protein [uncultured bacterium contig00154]
MASKELPKFQPIFISDTNCAAVISLNGFGSFGTADGDGDGGELRLGSGGTALGPCEDTSGLGEAVAGPCEDTSGLGEAVAGPCEDTSGLGEAALGS